jgi:hypothetical protein
MLPVALLATGMIAVGCDSDEDYTLLDQEYATMEEDALAAHTAAMEGWNEWNSVLSTVAVADDADESHSTAYTTAQTRLNEYKTRLDEGQTQIAQWRTDLDAAKEEGREAYQAKMDEAKTWFNDYNTWLAEYNAELQRYRDAQATAAADGSTPWYVTMYGTAPATEMIDTVAVSGDADGDDVINPAAEEIDDAANDAADEASETEGDDSSN